MFSVLFEYNILKILKKTLVFIIRKGLQKCKCTMKARSVQFSCSVMSDFLQLHGLQHARPPCPSPTSRLMSIELVMPSNHLILCCPLLLLSPIPLRVRVFSNESTLRMLWPKYWSFSFSISPSNDIQDWFPLGWTGWISLQSKGFSRFSSNSTVQKHQFFGAQLSL